MAWAVQIPGVPTSIAVTIASTDSNEKIGAVTTDDSGSGTTTVHPSGLVTYTLSVKGANGKVLTRSAPFIIDPPQIVTLSHSPDSVIVGSPITLKGSVQGVYLAIAHGDDRRYKETG